MHDWSDDDLLRQLQKGNNGAFDILMERYQQKLARFIYHYVGNSNAVDDLVQETFIKLFFNVSSFRFESQFSTWLFQIAVNLCKDYARKHKRVTVSLDSDSDIGEFALMSDDASPEQSIGSKRQLAKVSGEIERLPHKLKTALIAFAVEEQSQEECAKLLGITPKTVETRVYRARKLLSDRLLKLAGKR